MTILTEADELIHGDRAKAYGDAKENLGKIANQWELYIQQKFDLLVQLTAEDVCWMMSDLKKVRQMHMHNRDNLRDSLGYIGLIDEVV